MNFYSWRKLIPHYILEWNERRENSHIIFMQLSINHCTLNLSNDLTTMFKLNTSNKVKVRTPSKSESWKESSENNIWLVAATSENNININNNGIIKNDRSSKIGALISSNDKLIRRPWVQAFYTFSSEWTEPRSSADKILEAVTQHFDRTISSISK